MDRAFPIVLALSIIFSALMLILTDASVIPITFNVLSYGAVGNGTTDDTLAFMKAWNDTCNSKIKNPTMVIPKSKTFLVLPTTFAGPCSSNNINVMIQGNIIAPEEPNAWKQHDPSKWLVFREISGLVVGGVGVLDGRGKAWWDLSCRDHPGQGCVTVAPTALSFINCHQVNMSYIAVVNSPQFHIVVLDSDNVHFRLLYINSPATSPNTDGIHIEKSNAVTIHSSVIKAGDDCISIGDYTSNVNITYINCGPGHGISIGSLGRDESEAQVENILVRHVNFINTTNGARIKTWEGGKGFARKITFQYLNFTGVENPIIIDQHYCDRAQPCIKMSLNLKDSGVRVSDVSYYYSIGTSKTKVAVNFNCSQAVPCTNISLNSIQLASVVKGQQVISSCNNAHGGHKTGVVQPKSCLV